MKKETRDNLWFLIIIIYNKNNIKKMKRINLLIPSIAISAIAPVAVFSSCATIPNLYYINISEQGRQAAQQALQLGSKKWMEEPYIYYNLETFYMRKSNYLSESTVNMIKAAKEYYADADQRFVYWTCSTKESEFSVYTVTPTDNEYDKVIIYFHGGAYMNNLGETHVAKAIKLSNQLNAKIYFPIYGVAPQHNASECYEFLDEIYPKICERETKDIVFMGDSAGGGLAMAYSQYLYNKGSTRLPTARILYTPWLDISLSNPEVEKQDSTDIILAPFGLRLYGGLWAKDWGKDDYRVSPIKGEMDDKIKTLMFVGSGEIFKPDVLLMHQTLIQHGCESHVVICNDLFHVFELVITLPEAQESFKMCENFLNGKPLK